MLKYSGDPLFKKAKRYVITTRSDASRIVSFGNMNFPAATILTKLRRAINNATPEVTEALKEALDNAIRNNGWPHINDTRDIYDTGELMNSGSVMISGDGIKIVYTAPYAMLVHYGGYISPYGNMSTKVYLPPRPWIDAVLLGGGPVEKFDYISFYRRAIEVEFA